MLNIIGITYAKLGLIRVSLKIEVYIKRLNVSNLTELVKNSFILTQILTVICLAVCFHRLK